MAEQLGKVYQIKGKQYVRVKDTCPKCGGSGQYKHFGSCYKCNGSGYIIKEQPLEEEFEFRIKKSKNWWLKNNNFDESGNTYVLLIQQTYSMRQELKDLGFYFDYDIGWRIKNISTLPPNFGLPVAQINVKDFFEWDSNINRYLLTAEGKAKLSKMCAEARPSGNWFGELGERIAIKASLTGRRKYESSTTFYFLSSGGEQLAWTTASNPAIPSTSSFMLFGTVKAHGLDKVGNKITYLQRVRME